MYLKKFLSFVTLVSIFLTFVATASAVSISPNRKNYEVAPGEVIEDTIKITNTEAYPAITKITVLDLIPDPASKNIQYVDVPQPRGLLNWITIPVTEKLLEPSESYAFEYTINVPKDVAAGSYNTELFGSASAPDESGTRVGVTSRAGALVNVTIEGDYIEDLKLEEFNLNAAQLQRGNITFDVNLKNDGTITEQPFGNLTIFNEKGEQVKGVHAIKKTFEEQSVVVERQDKIPFNVASLGIVPNSTKNFQISWVDREATQGKYTAKLEVFYGADSLKLEDEVDFEISGNFHISEFNADNFFSSSLPVQFSVNLTNNGTVDLAPKGYFEIKNAIGFQKMRVDLTSEELLIPGGESKTINNLVWDNSFALGLYSATFNLDIEGQIYSETVSFWVISWWQTLILIIVLALIILGLYKGVHGYMNIQKKLAKTEKELEKVEHVEN